MENIRVDAMSDQAKQETLYSKPFLRPSVEDLASVLIPSEKQTVFLRACLQEREESRKAYKQWLELVNDPVMYFGNDEAGTKRLLPLFYDTVKRNGLDVEQQFLTYLRAARFTEEIRYDAYINACGHVLDILNNAGIEYMVLKGAAYAESFYPRPFLRHSDDLDLLVHEKDLFKAAKVLFKAGLKPCSYLIDIGTHHLTKIYHSSGLSVELHRRLYDPFCYHFPYEELWLGGRYEMIAGRKLRILGPVDSLLNILTHATICSSQRSLRWACDAFLLVKKYPDLDWNLFMQKTLSSRTVLPVSYTLSYMVNELQLPVPKRVLVELCKKSYPISFKQHCAFIYGVRNNYPKQFLAILNMQASFGFKIQQLLWLCFPFLIILPLTGGMRFPALAPFYYLLRLARTVVRRLIKQTNSLPLS